MNMATVIIHLAASGNWSTAPVGPTPAPKAGPMLQIDVQAAVKAVRSSSPVSDRPTARMPNVSRNAANRTTTDATTPSSSARPSSCRRITRLGWIIWRNWPRIASNSTRKRNTLIEQPVEAVQEPMNPTTISTRMTKSPQLAMSALAKPVPEKVDTTLKKASRTITSGWSLCRAMR